MISFKTIFLSLTFIFIISFNAFSQSKDSIFITYWPVVGYVFKHQDKYLLPMKARQIMISNPEAYSEMLKARRNSFGHRLLNISGIVMVIPFVKSLSGNEKVNFSPYLISCGVLTLSGYPFARAQAKHYRNAVFIYNSSL